MLGFVVALLAFSSGRQALGDNPRNRIFDHGVIEYVSITPHSQVHEIGDKPSRPATAYATLTAHLRNCSTRAGVMTVDFGGIGVVRTGIVDVDRTAEAKIRIRSADIPYGKTVSLSMATPRGGMKIVDRAPLYEEVAMRVALVVEEQAILRGNDQFGSFTRRMRKSFEDFHSVLAATDSTDPDVQREPIKDRFRLEFIEVFSREKDGRPLLFTDHDEFDLVVMCDEGGPDGGFWLPAYSIGHNFLNRTNGDGIWSTSGEQALWHELLHFRGVPDYYIYPIPAGAIGRWTEERVGIPSIYADDMLHSPYKEPELSRLTSLIVKAKHGVARVGACEETDHEYGHMWRWLPKELKLEVMDDDRKLAGTRVRWWRSRSAGLPDGRIQGVDDDLEADGVALTDGNGQVSISGDYLGSARARPERSLWLLFDVEHTRTRRFGIIWGLELNELWASGKKDGATISIQWADLMPVAQSPASKKP